MNVTLEASTLDWMNNGSTLWATRLDDLSGNSVVFSEGYTPTITNKLVKVTNATRPTGTLFYTGSGNGVTATVPLYGINNVVDTEDCVTGALTRNIGSADFSSLEWTEGEGTWTVSVNDIKADTTNVMSSNGYEIVVSGTNVTVTSSASPTGMFYYEKDSASVSTEATQTMAMTSGTNTLAQSDMGRRANFDLGYDGIDYTLALDNTHKYGFKHGSTGSILTEASSQDVVAGSDMVVDVTRLVNGDTTKINAISAWSDIVAGYPEYAAYVAYNTGEVVGVQPAVEIYWKNLFDVTRDITTFESLSTSRRNFDFSKCYKGLTYENVSYPTRVTEQSISGTTIHWTTNSNGVNYGLSFPFRVSPNKAYTLSVTENVNAYFRVAYYTKSGEYINKSSENTNNNLAFTTPNNCWILLVCFYTGSSTTASVTNPQLELGSSATAYEPYHDGGTVQAPAPLFAVGNVADEFEAVAGVTTHKMASVDMGTLTWKYAAPSTSYPNGRFYASVPNKQFGLYNVICSKYRINTINASHDKYIHGNESNSAITIIDSSLASDTDMSVAMSGVMLYYETTEPTTSQSTPAQISLQAGNNVVMQTDGGKTVGFTLDYDGTDYSIATEASHKYIKRINGTDDYITGGSPVAVRGKRDKLIDLTYMFGSGYEPATLAEFYKLFPTWMGYDIPYDGGSVLNFKGTGIVSVGFNLVDFGGRTLGAPQNTASSNTTKRGVFDETKFYVGLTSNNYYYPDQVSSYSVSNTQIVVTAAQSAYGVSFPIRCVPGATYRFESYQNPGNRFSFYTYDGTFISGIANQSAEAPANAYWCMVNYCVAGSNETITFTNPCVHLQWSGTRNGDYEQYWSYTRPLPTLTYFPNGMNGIGTVADEISNKQAVQRLRMVNLADVEWTESDGTWVNQFNDIKADTPNIIATGLQAFTLSGQTVTFYAQPTGYLVYELSTPVVTTFQDDVNLSYQVSDYGTESIVPVNGTTLSTAPLTAIVQYQGDYARTITKLPENYQSQKSMDALLELLGQLHGGVFTSTFNSATQSYGYNFTPNN